MKGNEGVDVAKEGANAELFVLVWNQDTEFRESGDPMTLMPLRLVSDPLQQVVDEYDVVLFVSQKE